MLSRVAISLMWMSRYIERANNLARIVEAIEELSLDHNHPEISDEEAFWSPVYDVLNLEDEKAEYIKEGNENTILYHLLLDKENFNSVASCISAARFNARGVRDQIVNEIWEVINDLHLQCVATAEKPNALNVAQFSAKVRSTIHCFRGLIESAISQEEAWSFLMVGMLIERADQMSRLLDLKTFMLSEDRKQVQLLEPYLWFIILKVSGKRSSGLSLAEVDWTKIEDALIFDPVNPNSIRYSVRKANEVLHSLSGTGTGAFTNSAEKACGKLKADLDYKAFVGLNGTDTHSFLDYIQLELGSVFNGVLDTYSYIPEMEKKMMNVQSQ